MKKRNYLAAFLALLLAVPLLTEVLPARVSAASSSEIKKQIAALEEEKDEIDERIAEVRGQYEANENEILDIVSRKNAIDQEIQLLYEQVENINQQVASYSLLIADQQEDLDNAKQRLEELNQKNKERIRSMEEDGKLSYWSVLFKSNSFSDLLDRLQMIKEIAAADQRRLRELSDAAQTVQTAQDALTEEKASLEQTREALDAAELVLEARRAEADALLTELVAQGAEFEALLEESENLQEELMQEIAQAEKDLKEAEYQEWLATYVPTTRPSGTDTTPSDQAPSSSGWVRPVSPFRVTSPFGMRLHPILGYERMHNGIDLGAPEGTPIYAAKSGKVTVTAYQANGAGNYVSINHGDGFSSIYMHMTRYIVSKGQYVSAGQVIGYVGNTGLSKGAHLHFGISYHGTYVNPLLYVS